MFETAVGIGCESHPRWTLRIPKTNQPSADAPSRSIWSTTPCIYSFAGCPEVQRCNAAGRSPFITSMAKGTSKIRCRFGLLTRFNLFPCRLCSAKCMVSWLTQFVFPLTHESTCTQANPRR
jgi:hypothetical protein